MRRFLVVLLAGSLMVAAVVAAAVLAGSSDQAADRVLPGSPTTPPSSTHLSSPTASPSSPPPALLAVIGDYGLRGGMGRTMVRVLADHADRYAAQGRFAGVLTTGDNAYDKGTAADVAFARELLDPLLGPGTRLVASLGNHDVATRGGDPLMRGFGMPGRYYSTVVGLVQVVVLDANRPTEAAQVSWLRQTLAAPARAPFRVAVFHQPAASCSRHAADRDIARNWLPLLRGKVDLVLAGHNHAYERFDSAGLPMVTTGGGGAALYGVDRGDCSGPARPQVLRSAYNVVVLSATPQRLQLVALDRRGQVFDRLELSPQ